VPRPVPEFSRRFHVVCEGGGDEAFLRELLGMSHSLLKIEL